MAPQRTSAERDKVRWWIWVHGEREGPFSSLALAKDRRVHARTLVWREGMERPYPLEEVAELAWLAILKWQADVLPPPGEALSFRRARTLKELVWIGVVLCVVLFCWLIWIGAQ